MIRYDDVSVVYEGKTILSGFSLEIKQFEKVVLWGKSGSGKSSLMAMVPGFNTPASGSVSVAGLAMTKAAINEIREKIAWVPQDISFPFESIKQLIEAPFEFKINKDNKPSRETVITFFEELGLDISLYDKRVSEVSGGELQRIMIIIAVLLKKEILLLDEPTSALDPESIGKLISFLRRQKEMTLFAISHDQHFASSFDRQIKI